jgi:phage-related protein
MTRKRMPARFYCNINGIEPVREWLLSIDKQDRALIGQDIKTVEYGWPIGMPTCRSMGGGLWEVRSNLSNGKIARVLFCCHAESLILLHVY